MDTIRQFEPDTEEYGRLRIASQEMTKASTKGTIFSVGDCYFDFGQRWMWTTIIAHRPDGEHWQVLSPADHERILSSPCIRNTVFDIMHDKYWYE